MGCCCCCCGGKLLWGILLAVSLVIFALGFIFTYAAFPAIIEGEVSKNLDLWNPDSEGRLNFEIPPVPVYMKFMLFTVENSEDATKGEKIRFNIVGPYSYKEDRHKVNISEEFEDQNTLTYAQYKGYAFDQDTSCETCKADDNVIMINAPLLGIISVFDEIPLLGDTLKDMLNKAITSDTFSDSLFLTDTVDKILFHGSNPGSVRWLFSVLAFVNETLNLDLSSILPPVLDQEKGFAVFNGRVNTTNNEAYKVNTGYADLSQYLEIEKWGPSIDVLYDDLTPAGWWKENGGWNGSNAANTLKGTDGQQVKPFVTEEDRVWLYQTDICRVLYAEFQEHKEVDGIPLLGFVVPKRALQANTKFNYGFCMEAEGDLLDWDACVTEDMEDEDLLDFSKCNLEEVNKRRCQDSVLDLSSCQGGAPVWFSSPHFINSPEFFRTDFDGIPPPDPKLHDTTLDIEPNTGIVIALHKRVQVNIPMFKDSKIDVLAMVNNETLVPILWLDEQAVIDQENIDKIRRMVVTPILATEVVQWLFVALGALGTIITAFMLLWKCIC